VNQATHRLADPVAVVVNAKSPYNTLQEFIDAAKANLQASLVSYTYLYLYYKASKSSETPKNINNINTDSQ
jgi:hypothetical protein